MTHCARLIQFCFVEVDKIHLFAGPKKGEIVMGAISRRNLIATTAGGTLLTATTATAQTKDSIPQPQRPGHGGTDPGPRDLTRERKDSDILVPPATGTLRNLRFSFTAIDPQGRNFVDDVGAGDLWYFASGIPHSIQGLSPDGAEFLLVFDDGDFDEDNTFLISDWVKHTPSEVLAKNFGVNAALLAETRDPSELYGFPMPVPGPLSSDKIGGVTTVPQTFSHRMFAQQPIKTESGAVRITDLKVFSASRTIAAALVEVEPGAMQEMHCHPNTDEWQYYIEGEAPMGVFAAAGQTRTFDYRAGDVGFVSFAMGHTSRIPATRGCGSSKYSRATTSRTYHSTSGWRYAARTRAGNTGPPR